MDLDVWLIVKGDLEQISFWFFPLTLEIWSCKIIVIELNMLQYNFYIIL